MIQAAGRWPAGHRPTPAAARVRISVGLVITTRVRISLGLRIDRRPELYADRRRARTDRRPAVTEKFLKMIVNCVVLISQNNDKMSVISNRYTERKSIFENS